MKRQTKNKYKSNHIQNLDHHKIIYSAKKKASRCRSGLYIAVVLQLLGAKQYSLHPALDVSIRIIPSILLRAFLIILTLTLLHSKGSVTTLTP